MNLRKSAILILKSVLIDRHKADVALDRQRTGFDARDFSLLHEIVYGVLRRYFSLEADFSRFLKQKPDDLTRLALFVGACQLRHMRVPAHAAISETVAAVKSLAPKDAGFVNAVLRKVAGSQPPEKLKPYQRAELPHRFYAAWRDAFGVEAVQTLAAASMEKPGLAIAVFGERDDWMRRCDVDAVAGELCDYAVLLPSGCDVPSLPGFAAGEFIVMDQAAQAAVLALKVDAGDKVLDLCAAPGGKTALLARLNPDADVTAVELSEKRIARLQENLDRVGATNVAVVQGDATALGFEDGSFDAILLDAPCTASGVIRRHPDARFIHDREDLLRHSELQKRMVAEALRVLKPGGRLVYAVCSIHQEENEQVVDAFPELQSCDRLLPSETHDGFFIARLIK